MSTCITFNLCPCFDIIFCALFSCCFFHYGTWHSYFNFCLHHQPIFCFFECVSGLMVSILNCRSRGLGFDPGVGSIIVYLISEYLILTSSVFLSSNFKYQHEVWKLAVIHPRASKSTIRSLFDHVKLSSHRTKRVKK